MNLGVEADSPWSDERSNSPQAPNGQNSESEANTTSPSSSTSQPVPSVKATVKSPGGRPSRTSRKTAVQATPLEAVNIDNDPLGPSGPLTRALAADEEAPPELPQKEPQNPKSPRPSTATSQTSRQAAARSGPVFGDDGRPVSRSRLSGVPHPDGSQAQQTASVDVERPTFYISVGDPHKVGDLTGSHTAYQVRTKTNSKAYRQPEFEVARRYKDFLWLYNQLHGNNPGTIVPPPPEKQAVGRFEQDFVEGRRSALERMLNKTAQHLVLQHDSDFKIFLESESFSVDVKNRERKDPDMPVESKGMFSSLNIGVGNATKFVEHDDWFLDRRVYLDTLEGQLRSLLKSIDSAIAQRKSLSEASHEFSISLDALSQVELSPLLTGPLASLADIQLRIRDLYARQAQQDALTLSNTLDEYTRLIGSIKKAFYQREKSWQGWHTAENDLSKRRSQLEKLHRQGRTQQDRIQTLQADVSDAERRAHQARLTFEDLGRGMRAELERFEREKVEDFRMGVETWLEGGVEAQKELIELWETYLMHLDADEEEQAAADGDPSAVETWKRSQPAATDATAEDSTPSTSIAGETLVAGSSTAGSDKGGTNTDSPLPPPPSYKQQSGDDVREEHTEHDEAGISETTVKPGTDAAVAEAVAASEERDL